MADNKKVETPKAGAASAETKAPDKASTTKDPNDTSTPSQAGPKGAADNRTPVDQPSESVKVPTVNEVKVGAEIAQVDGTLKEGQKSPSEAIKDHVEATAKSVQALNDSNKAVSEAEPFVKPEVKTRPAPTAEERLAQNVDAVAKSAQAFNESAKAEEKSTANQVKEREQAAITAQKEESRVAPLTGELRTDPENDSYVTPGKVLAPKDPTSADLAPEIEQAPKVISPLTGEVKPADEVSYPTPGHVRDPSIASKALNTNRDKFMLEGSGKTPFGVAPGQQVNLLAANEEAWRNDAAIREDQKQRAKDIAEALVSTDGLRRTRRVQKNLR